MKCYECQEQKLSSEFPQAGLSAACKHAPTLCLECVESYIEGCIIDTDAENPQDADFSCPECGKPARFEDCGRVRCRLEALKVGVLATLALRRVEQEDLVGSGTIRVCLLSGDVHHVEVSQNDSSRDVKDKIFRASGVEVDRQRLWHKGREVLDLSDDGSPGGNFVSFGIPFGATLNLMILLYEEHAQDDAVRRIQYQLSWTQRQRGIGQMPRSYIDAICFVLTEDGTPLGHVTWTRQGRRGVSGIDHSGPAMDSCQQTMDVDCYALPPNAGMLVFALAAAPNVQAQHRRVSLADFRNPTVALLDATTRRELMRPFSIPSAGNSQCVILACARKDQGARWSVQGVGRLCEGNSYDTANIEIAILEMCQRMAETLGGQLLQETGNMAVLPMQPTANGQGASRPTRQSDADLRPPRPDMLLAEKKEHVRNQILYALAASHGGCELPALGSIPAIQEAWKVCGYAKLSDGVKEHPDLFHLTRQDNNGNLVVTLTSQGRALARSSVQPPNPHRGVPKGRGKTGRMWDKDEKGHEMEKHHVEQANAAPGSGRGLGEKGHDLRGWTYGWGASAAADPWGSASADPWGSYHGTADAGKWTRAQSTWADAEPM